MAKAEVIDAEGQTTFGEHDMAGEWRRVDDIQMPLSTSVVPTANETGRRKSGWGSSRIGWLLIWFFTFIFVLVLKLPAVEAGVDFWSKDESSEDRKISEFEVVVDGSFRFPSLLSNESML